MAVFLLGGGAPRAVAKSYGSGGGHSYSSHSSGSSHSFSSGGSHSSGFSSSGGKSYHSSSFGSGSSRSSGSGGSSTVFSSGSGKSYGSGSAWSDAGRKSYSSGKSYSSTARTPSTSKPMAPSDWPARSSPPLVRQPSADQRASGFTFDTAAARAKQEEASKQEFTRFKEAQAPAAARVTADTPRPASAAVPEPSYRGQPPPIYSTRTYIPEPDILATRSIRIGTVFNPYRYRPMVIYRDPYDSLFWWWLLDRSLDDRAYWAYHHHYDMDPARYQALVESDQQLRARVEELEARQVARDTNYVPAGLDRDLMYSDRYVGHVYSHRPTLLGAVAFWALGVPTAMALCVFFVWLVWFKRWQTAT